MSQENVEIVRRGIDAWNRGDVDEILVSADPDIEWRPSGLFPGLDPVYSGHDGYRKFWRDFYAAWNSIRISVRGLQDCGESVVALCTFEARGRDGMEVHRKPGSVYTV
jgi:ketosteroid isomerase-like protein